MDVSQQPLVELLTLTARSLTHLTAAMTSLSFELLRSEDPVVRDASKRMITRMAAVNGELDQHWQLISDLTGVSLPDNDSPPMTEVHLAPVVPIAAAER
ncbi:hypothetical protein [Pseudomonas mangiferae]|uniref:Uncharacterized protein n=1 Tax=Pseudomonas mangiferae TaxID=2593654 RepID=A0A553H4G7_9PSED|nr:hypothetical protein [Pseudomonas mangiferae]TRX76645.1 hypothetical protein FM069_01070 [Pseudomonas mangiferae]